MHYPKIYIIVLNWNGRDDTLVCLDSLRKIDYPNFDVLIVDNGSSDDSVQAIKKTFPEVAVLETGANLGFAGGNNIGMRYALESGAAYLFLLNNDTVVDPQVLNSFIDALTYLGKEAILGSKIYYYFEQNRIWYAGTKWENNGFKHLGMGETDDGQKFNRLTETAYACGCALFVSRTILEKIGFFDEKFFAYFEETDFCYRAKAAGFRSFFVPAAVVWHKVSSSSGGEKSPLFYYYMNRNVMLWAERHLPLYDKLKLYRRILEVTLRE
jgi:GT2 family glycosyltransferase